jgi:predicted permease
MALPREFVRRHGREMEALFLATLHEAAGLAAARVWLAAIADVAAAALRRRRSLRPAAAPSPGWSQMLSTHIRSAGRSLRRQPGATGLAIGMLALGIAANIAVFTLVNGIFLRPFQLPEPDRLVYINETAPKWNLEYVGINYPDFAVWQREQRLLSGIALHDGATFNFADGATVERLRGTLVTRGFFDVLGVAPILGRTFTAGEDRPDGPRVALLGESFWRDRFGADPGVLGRTLRLDSRPVTIVGVVPARADFGFRASVWLPLQGDPAQPYQSYSYTGIGRLKAGVTVAEADADLKRAHQSVWQARDEERFVSPFVRDMRAELTRDYDSIAVALGAAVSILLLVACANVASVMLARALGRRREMGIRLAIGASRARLLGQLFVENVLLAVAGGALGLLLGTWALDGIVGLAADQVPGWARFDVDWRVLVFSIGLTTVTAVLFGWAPALHALGGNLRGAMQTVTVGTTEAPAGRRTLGWLVSAEFALAAVLLVSGGLLYRAFDRVRQTDPGFSPDRVLTFSIYLPEVRYADAAARYAFWQRLALRLSALPGVERVGLVSCAPLGCHQGNLFEAEGHARGAGEENPVTLVRVATPGYAATMGLRVVRGRFLQPADDAAPRAGEGGVVVINETFARTFFPAIADPVGRRIRNLGNDTPWMTVVGVVGDVRHYGIERPMRPGVYQPLSRRPADSLTVALKTSGEPLSVTPAARAALAELDAELPIYLVRSMPQALADSMELRRAYSWLLGVFALLAAMLAVGGGYGVTSYLAAQRTRELGIRIALGARGSDILRAILGSSLARAATGIAVGLLMSLATSRLLGGLLFGVSPHDLAVMGSAGGILVAAAVAAGLWPARRSTKVDPVGLLRSE